MIGDALKPLIVQSDSTLLLDVHHPSCEEARADILPFSELEKSPEHIHTYRITPLSLWNAASSGLVAEDIVDALKRWSRFTVPENIVFTINETISRFGKIRLLPSASDENLMLTVEEDRIRRELAGHKKLKDFSWKPRKAF
jgi:DNA excision repair protein ERCC-3